MSIESAGSFSHLKPPRHSARERADTSPSTEVLRIRGSLVRRLGTTGLRAAESGGVDVLTASTDEKLHTLQAISGVTITGSAETSVETVSTALTLLRGVTIDGAEHRSPVRRDRFDRSPEDQRTAGGKFGPGTYFSLGPLSGETMDALRALKPHVHEATVGGNFLIAKVDGLRELEQQLRSIAGIREPKLRSNIRQSHNLTDLVSAAYPDVNATIMLMPARGETEAAAAEMIVHPGFSDTINVHTITPPAPSL